jgi:phosphonate transport system substrate-binding protein
MLTWRYSRLLALAALPFCMLAAKPSVAADKSVKIVVTAAFVSNAGLDVYDSIAEYLTKKTGLKIEVVSGLSYAQADKALADGSVALGAVCGLPYIHKTSEYELVAVPVMATEAGRWEDAPGYAKAVGKYFSYTIVRKDSNIKSWDDLRGKTYAFNDMGSNSGYNMPRHKLVTLGQKNWKYFSKVVVSGSHEESIRLVSEGLVDASSVDSLVLDYDRANSDPYANNVRIVEVLGKDVGGLGAPPIVISKKSDLSVKKPIQDALVGMHKDPEGKKILERALLKSFIVGEDKNFDDIRRWEKEAQDAGFADWKPDQG